MTKYNLRNWRVWLEDEQKYIRSDDIYYLLDYVNWLSDAENGWRITSNESGEAYLDVEVEFPFDYQDTDGLYIYPTDFVSFPDGNKLVADTCNDALLRMPGIKIIGNQKEGDIK